MADKIDLPEPQSIAALTLRADVSELPYAAPDGEFFASVGRKYLKNAGLAVFHMIGGVEAMAKWANANKSDYYTKIYPKLLEKQVEITDNRTIEDVVNDLDNEVIDVDYDRV